MHEKAGILGNFGLFGCVGLGLEVGPGGIACLTG